jgi:hypothetical protein
MFEVRMGFYLLRLSRLFKRIIFLRREKGIKKVLTAYDCEWWRTETNIDLIGV